MKKFKVGIDSYSLKPLGHSPFEILDWALMNDADGVQFSEAPEQAGDRTFLDELSQYADQNSLYLEWGGGEHVPFDLTTGKPRAIAAVNKKAAEQASRMGIRVVRSCSGGLMRWKDDSIPTKTLLLEMAKSLRAQKSTLKDLGIVLAIETHFEFTTFELLRLFDMCDAEPGDYLGICLDTMNLLTMLEEPVAATRRILPWVVTTHIKDGGILLAADGLISFTAEAGKGVVDFRKIFEELSSLERIVNFSIEDHGGDFRIPIFDPIFLTKFPDLTVPELAGLLKLASQTKQLMDGKELFILDRSRWPEICESRVKRDIRHIRKILEPAGQMRL
jgi:sugar phosphate isomerase/epimerase